jgi:hypothetical protein
MQKSQKTRKPLRRCNSPDEVRLELADWVRSLDPDRARRPILIAGGRSYTPRDLLQEANHRSKLGAALLDALVQLRIIKTV